jgi:hypothetical protein
MVDHQGLETHACARLGTEAVTPTRPKPRPVTVVPVGGDRPDQSAVVRVSEGLGAADGNELLGHEGVHRFLLVIGVA